MYCVLRRAEMYNNSCNNKSKFNNKSKVKLKLSILSVNLTLYTGKCERSISRVEFLNTTRYLSSVVVCRRGTTKTDYD